MIYSHLFSSLGPLRGRTFAKKRRRRKYFRNERKDLPIEGVHNAMAGEENERGVSLFPLQLIDSLPSVRPSEEEEEGWAQVGSNRGPPAAALESREPASLSVSQGTLAPPPMRTWSVCACESGERDLRRGRRPPCRAPRLAGKRGRMEEEEEEGHP